MKVLIGLLCLVLLKWGAGERDVKLVLDEEFNMLNMSLWRHEITAGIIEVAIIIYYILY